MAAGEIPESMDHWKPEEIDEDYIKQLRDLGWISDFVVTKENKGAMCFRFDTTEIPVFESHLICGFNLPPSKFLERVCKYYSIELLHLKPQAIALLSIFSTLCECWLGTAPSFDLWRVYHEPRYYSSGLVGCVSFNVRKKASYPHFAYRRSWGGYRWKYFIMDDSSKHDIKGKGLLPFYEPWNKSVPVMDERLKNMTAKVTELVTRGLRGEHIVEEYVRRGFFPLQHREPLAMFGDGPRNPTWLPAGDLVKKRLWAILESTKQDKPEGFSLPYSAANPAEQDMFGPDPSEGGADNTMVLESSSSEKEPREPPKKSSAEVFADTVLNSPDVQASAVDLQSLEEKVDDLKSTLVSSVAPKTQALKPPSPPKPAATESSSQPKPRAPPRTRSSKAKPSEEPPKIKLQPARKRKLKSPATTSVTPSTELLRANPGGASSANVPTQALQAPSGTSSSGLSVFGKIMQEVQAAEAWHMKTCKAYSTKDAKISQLEADMASAKQALAESQAAHASEVESLRSTNSSLTSSVEDLKNKSKLLDEKLALKEQDLQNLQQEVAVLNEDKKKLKAIREEAVEEGYARCIAGSAYTLALFKHHLPHLNLDFVKTGFVCDSVQQDLLMDQVHAEVDSFVTAMQLIPSTTPAEEEAPAEAPTAEDDDLGDGQE
ncbi:hypothetical protein EJB05_08573, partial [Eragrostis curvula]